jgi:hypothetical protein
MATVSITGSTTVLGQLPTIGSSFPLAIAPDTATENADGTWRVTGHVAEANIPDLQGLGCTVQILVSDADEVAEWQAIDDQIDSGPGVA